MADAPIKFPNYTKTLPPKSRAGRKADPIRDSKCLDLKVQGYSYEEIAEQVGVSQSTAFESVARALKVWMNPIAEEVAAAESYKLYRLEHTFYPMALSGDRDHLPSSVSHAAETRR